MIFLHKIFWDFLHGYFGMLSCMKYFGILFLHEICWYSFLHEIFWHIFLYDIFWHACRFFDVVTYEAVVMSSSHPKAQSR